MCSVGGVGGDLAASLLSDLQTGAITKAAYASQARDAGVDAKVVAANLRSAVSDGVAAVAAEKERLESQAAASAAFTDQAPATANSLDLSSELTPVEAALAWLKTRPHPWGARAAERLSDSNDFLYDLELYDSCEIDDEGASHLATALGDNTMLTSLNLSSNKISDPGIAALCEALKTNTTLTTLELSGNKIGSAGAAALAGLLAASPTLKNLDLRGNDSLGDDGRAAIQSAWAAASGAAGAGVAPREVVGLLL